ncbi:uncharacterized protein TNCT_589101 [Trichonephila clavata]|uniref:DUF5641 domain-containing protein n=1 Tax=Trichonephila clavata TaxID=2740835 RepID=A0A8X6G1U8_TRICU|nr:uncharacterized protein TNCT_589101 [Trichonephila clavata]
MDKNCLIQRKVLRSAVTKTISELDNCIAANDFPAASLAFTKLEEKTKRLFENDELVITYLSSHPDPDTDPDTIVENELEQNETYRDNFISAKVRFQEFSKIYEQKTQQLDISPSMDRLSINLPKLQLIDFDGNPKNWFSFWSMFQKIDEDPKIEDDVKFAYLMQTTKGKAFDFVQSYHVSKGEYKTVIKNLKTRFADDKMLIELYVRELLKLILNQSHNMSFTDLVDQLDTYLRCLENLGVTKEKYACMLYPLVEASIPEQILIAWERERNSISRNSTANTHDLDLLIQFLRSEVVSAERLRIAKAFCAGEKDKNKTIDESTTTLHMFSDASGKAFAACVFLRIECDNKVKIKLVQAKSRVAPLKKDPITKTKNEMSIPKLELLAAVIGTRLVQSVKTSLNIHSIQTFYWTDSKVVLCWIKNSGTWKTFVRNRIKEIHSSSSKEDWYYVPSQMNAADIASRGCNAQTLFSLCWWEGPIWLKNRSSWPDTKDSDFKDALELATEERKPTVTTNLSLNDSDSNFFEWTKRVSKFSSIVRTLAYVKRFLSNAKSVANRQKDSLLKGNLSEKELEILLFIQKETFGKNRRLIPPNFVVYLDSDGLLRVETKLFSTDTGDYFRRPILLPDKHELVLRLIEETHRIHNHAGIQALDLDLNDMQNLRKRAKHLHAVKHKLKTRFQKEYISLLKQTSNKVQTPLSVGDIVLISLDNKKRVDWPLAKIVEIYKGRDGVSRVARLKTQSGELIRPIQRLCRLETSGKIAEIMREPITTRRGRTIKS